MNFSPERVRQLAYMCAGAGAAAVLQDAPNVTMPTHSLSQAVETLLTEAGFDEPPQCLICGCTDENACEGGCTWVASELPVDVCSVCVERLAAAMSR